MINFFIAVIKFLFVIGFLVIIHEGGHFLVAKLFKAKVNEFSVGFGHKIVGKQIGETFYALRAIPLGGYVALEGEDKSSEDPRAFNKLSAWKRILIVAAGGVVNIIFGLIILNFTVHDVELIIKTLFLSIKDLFVNGISKDQLVGPIGISTIVSQAGSFAEFMNVMAIISISLGITNLMPFPPLDGGKILIYLIEIIRRKKLNEQLEMSIQGIGFMLMIGLSICVAINDVVRFF